MRASTSSKFRPHSRRPLRAKLIFNAGSGKPEESLQQLATILSEMQDQQILPEVYTTRPDSQLEEVVHGAIKSGIKLIVVAGGDGTIDSIAGAMVGSDATLGIIPTGTRNNVAFNLGITGDIASSVALLRQGRRLKIDVGRVHCGHSRHWFLEGVALGLISDLYPMADDIQHGKLAQIGGLLSTLVSATPSRLRMVLDDQQTPRYDGPYDVDHEYAFSRATLPDFPECILQGRPFGRFHFFGYEQTEHALLCHAVSRRFFGGCRYHALPRQTCNPCFKPANACTSRRYSIRPGFIIRSCLPARPDGHGWHRAYGTICDNGGDRSQGGAR